MLYSAMEDYYIDIVVGEGPTAHPVHFLAALYLDWSNDRAGMLSAPLRDRFGIVEHMNYYNQDELKQIIFRSARIFDTKLRSRGT